MKRRILLALLTTLAANTLFAAGYTKNVAIVIFEGVEALDLAAPVEVFAEAGRIGANGNEQAFNVYTVASSRAPVASQGLLDVVADYALADAPKPDILVLPGGRGSMGAIQDAALMAWIKASARDADHVLTICYGAFIAGKAGLLDGLEATTWYGSVEMMAMELPNVRPQVGRRFVDNGKVITTAGVAAGLDGSLHLVARTLGRYVAERTAEYMEYPWAPPSYSTATYPQLNPRLDDRGRKLQLIAIHARDGNHDAVIETSRALIARNRADADAWLALGRSLAALKRYDEAIGAYAEAARDEAKRGAALFNTACAYALAGNRDRAIDAAAKAIAAGFTMKHYYLHDTDLASIQEEPRFQALMAKL
jgi:transcriptional regulator GlxA family with amidase domain